MAAVVGTMSSAFAALLFLLLRVSDAETAWSPTVSLKHIDALEGSLRKIAKGYTKWSPSLLTFAKHVSEDVHRVVGEVEAKDSTLTDEAKSARIAGAVWELEELKSTMEKTAGITEHSVGHESVARSRQMKAALEKQLKEKKLELKHLLSERKLEEDAEVKEIADQHDQSEIVAKLLTFVKNSTGVRGAATAAAPRVMQALQKREETLSLALKSLDDEEKTAVARHRRERKDLGFGSIKAQMNLATVWKKQQIRYHKVVALKKAEKREINMALKSIQDGDMKTLQKTMKKMKRAARASEARGGHFLHFLQ